MKEKSVRQIFRFFVAFFLAMISLPAFAQNRFADRWMETGVRTEVRLSRIYASSGFSTGNPAYYLVDGNPNTSAIGANTYGTRGQCVIIVENPVEGNDHANITGFRLTTAATGDNETQQRPAHIKIEACDLPGFGYWVEDVYEADLDRGQTEWSVDQFTNKNRGTRGAYIRITLTPNNHTSARINVNELTFFTTSAPTPIQHKWAKWYDVRNSISAAAQDMDSFADDQPWFTSELSTTQEQIQAAHTYIDTIYVHKGDDVTLVLPDVYRSSPTADVSIISASSYQRWYSYRTDGTFEIPNKTDARYDLLTPIGSTPAYRFANGYVGQPVNAKGNGGIGNTLYQMQFHYPTDTEFAGWYGADAGRDNNWYVVACDVSSYTDFTPTYSQNSQNSTFYPSSNADGKVYEPTLTHRVLYYIVGVDGRGNDASENWVNGHGRLSQATYQGGGNGTGKKYLEEYEITFPSRRMSIKTNELVALSKDAASYAIPGADAGTDGYATFKCSLADNDAGIGLANTTFSDGNLRTISFTYPNRDSSDGTRYVNDADGDGISHATILVTKTAKVGGTTKTYNIARYRLTFMNEVQQLTQAQVDEIEKAYAGKTSQATGKYWNFEFRTPQYLEDNYELLTSMDWDYDPDVPDAAGVGSKEYYPFPMDWGHSSYSFFDGSQGSNFTNNNKFPEWGYYAITNAYLETDKDWLKGSIRPTELAKGSSRYHIYVDASDRPGIVTRLPFDQKLCYGSELFVSAWVKGAGSVKKENPYQTNNEDACILFTIMGVRNVTQGGRTTQVYTPVYRYSTGQLHPVKFLSTNIPGCGTTQDSWYQVYFSFINQSDDNEEFDSYVLQVENNSYSTSGGDFYVDDVRVYMATPSAAVSQLEAGCSDRRTLMNIRMDWERYTSRLGTSETDEGIGGIDFVFVDKTDYEKYRAQGLTAAQALEKAVVPIGDGETYDQTIATLYHHPRFEDNTPYNGTREHPALAKDNGDGEGHYFFYRSGSAQTGNRELQVDFYSELTPNRPYWMLIYPHVEGRTATFEDFAGDLDDPCGIRTEFRVTSQTLLKMNGEIVEPGTSFCAGQVFDFSAQLRVPVVDDAGKETYVLIDHGVNFDWFFGSEDDFLLPREDYDGESVQSALTAFRSNYPEATALSEETTPPVGEGETAADAKAFTQNQFDLLLAFSTEHDEGPDLNARLVLCRERLDIELLTGGLQLVIQPIQTDIPPGFEGLTEDQWGRVCWNYIPLTLNTTADAPVVHPGFNAYQYPSDDYNPNLRIGLAQIRSTTADSPLRIELRGARTVTEGATHLGPVEAGSSSDTDLQQLYLVATNDPAYTDFINSADFSATAFPVGRVVSLYAEDYKGGSDFNDHVDVLFYTDGQPHGDADFAFEPKEGYWYTFTVYFEEFGAEDMTTACYGQFNVRMNVVPEYLEWKGGATDNWNNDLNWKRVNSASRLHMAEGGSYPGTNLTENGYVPMLFSKVIIPRDSRVQLYRAGWKEGGKWDSERPAWMGAPTDSIQYDLMAYDDTSGDLTTKPYRVALCKEIHFEPGAEMLHAAYLLAERVWTDVELPANQWSLVSTPLQNTFAGDFYTQSSGRQETEYFRPITFGTGYNRLDPAVYQRSWNAGAAEIVELGGGTTPVSFQSVWSSVYNDASVPYGVGSGFSVNPKGATGGKVLFRLPKDDASYSVATNTGTLVRDSIGQLKSTLLVERNTDKDKTKIYDWFTSELTPSADGRFYIVGNPFLSQLDIEAFLNDNKDVLQQKFWMPATAGGADPMTGGADAEGHWTTTGSDAGTALLPPFGAFYVEALDGVTGPVEVKFYGEHQKLSDNTSHASMASTSALVVTAESEAGRSRAAVAVTAGAGEGFGEGDVQLVTGLDAGTAPQVYTVAGQTAASVNSLPGAAQVPLGVFAAEGQPLTLTFTGVAALRHPRLYDAERATEQPLHEGDVLSLFGASHGRYFLRFDGAGTTSVGDATAAAGVNIYSIQSGTIIVAATEDLLSVDVYAADGRQLRGLRPSGTARVQVTGLVPGVYVVRAATATGPVTAKVRVR